jgi:potassium-transporting ATPase ATP-binding subunit
MTSKVNSNADKKPGSTGVITVKQGELIPCDGVVIDGLAMVDESAICGVSTPVLIDNTAGRNNVLADTLVVEGTLTIQCSKK